MNELHDEALRGVHRGGRAHRRTLVALTRRAIWVPLSSVITGCSSSLVQSDELEATKAKKSSPGSDDQGQSVIEKPKMNRNFLGSGKCAGFPGEGDRTSFALAPQLTAHRHKQDLALWIVSGASCSQVTGARIAPGRV
ncbi:hypothetical protein GRJ2_000006700 [Grus japonensis]|uniref:Uncharacterized protein n=1 Tax=Grus japonensis TaxID=30415 RepID=A0ABC9VQH0_GRUJA